MEETVVSKHRQEYAGIFTLLRDALKHQPDRESLSGTGYGTVKNLMAVLAVTEQHWLTAAVVVLLAIIAGGLSFPIPLLGRYFIDNVLLRHDRLHFFDSFFLLIGITAGEVIVIMFLNYCAQLFEQRALYGLFHHATRRILGLPQRFFDISNRNDCTISRLNDDINSSSWLFSAESAHLLVNFVQMVGGILFLFVLDFRAGILAAVFFLFFSLVVMKVYRHQYILSSCHDSKLTTLKEINTTTFENISTVKISTSEYKIFEKNMAAIDELHHIELESLTLNSFAKILSDIIQYTAHIVLLMLTGWWFIHNGSNMTLGTIFAMQIYLWFSLIPLANLCRHCRKIENSKVAMLRLVKLFNVKSEYNLTSGNNIYRLCGKIVFDNVAFQYPNRHILLKQISFTINAGDKVAIVGLNNSGKSTLAALLLGVYRPNRGTIYIDDLPLDSLNIRQVRKLTGYIPKNPLLFSGTLADIIRYFASKSSDEKILRALEKVGLKQFAALLPNGIHTRIEKINQTLSVSMRQRLILAAYMIKRPDMLIIDHLNDRLDYFNEARVMQNVMRDFADKTCIIITDKYRTVMQQNKVILLHQGKIANVGTPKELQKQSSLFCKIFRLTE